MTHKENKDWQHWHEQHPHESASLLKRLWEATGSYRKDYHPNEAAGLAALKSRMNQHQPAKVVRLSPSKIALRIAAGLALLLIATFFFKNQIGESSSATAVSTPANETKELALEDGSSVTLNQSSQLDYPGAFSKKERKLKLQGEAHFKVNRDENRPFIIETEAGFVKVLGTSFNVRSYPNDGVFEVFVETGKVSVALKTNDKTIELGAGEFLRLDKSTNKAQKGLDKSGTSNAWRTGAISFREQTIPAVLTGMERLYGVKMDLKNEQPNNCLQTLSLEKGKMEEAIEALKTSCPKLKFAKNDVGYVVTGVCCQ